MRFDMDIGGRSWLGYIFDCLGGLGSVQVRPQPKYPSPREQTPGDILQEVSETRLPPVIEGPVGRGAGLLCGYRGGAQDSDFFTGGAAFDAGGIHEAGADSRSIDPGRQFGNKMIGHRGDGQLCQHRRFQVFVDARRADEMHVGLARHRAQGEYIPSDTDIGLLDDEIDAERAGYLRTLDGGADFVGPIDIHIGVLVGAAEIGEHMLVGHRHRDVLGAENTGYGA